MKPVLFGIGLSPYVRKLRFILAFKGVDYDFDPVIPMQTPEGFDKFSPLKKIPAMKFGDFAISDSSVLAQYIEKKYPEPGIISDNPEDLARALWIEEYADSLMTEILGGIFFNKFAKPLVFKMPADMKRVAELEQRLPEIFDYLESQASGKKYLVGEQLSLADFAVISILQNFVIAGYEVDSQKWPAVAAYHKSLLQNDVISKVLVQESSELASMQ